MDLFFIIFIIFIIYVLIQIYYYAEKYIKNNHNYEDNSKNHNNEVDSKIESFESNSINAYTQNQYHLEDASLEILLDDYEKLKEPDI